MSKIDKKQLESSLKDLYTYCSGGEIQVGEEKIKGKKRNFTETIEVQIALKNFDPRKDKKVAGTYKLPRMCYPNLRVCVLGNEIHCEAAQQLKIDFKNQNTLGEFKKDQKVIKKWAKKYDAFIASSSLIKQLPKLLGPALSRANKNPSTINDGENLLEKIEALKSTVKYQMKKVPAISHSCGNITMKPEEVMQNIIVSTNFLVSLLKKGWQQIKNVYIHSTMGRSFVVYM